MALMDMPRHASRGRSTEAREATLMRVAVYPACLLAALFGRLGGAGKESPRISVFAEARAQASACVAFAFR